MDEIPTFFVPQAQAVAAPVLVELLPPIYSAYYNVNFEKGSERSVLEARERGNRDTGTAYGNC